MKTAKRAARLTLNLVLLALLLLTLWALRNFESVDKLGRLRERYMLTELEPLYQGFEGERICDAGEHYAVVWNGVLMGFAEKNGGVTAFPAGRVVNWPDSPLYLYALGEVPGAAYAEAEVRLDHYKGYDPSGGVMVEGERAPLYDPLEPWVEIYSARCEYADGLALLTVEPKYDKITWGWSDRDQRLYTAAESLAFDTLSLELGGTYGNSPACYATLRYYGADGTLLAQRDLTVVPEWDKETYHIGDLP
ncbi:MAG: hypothetical protein ACI4PC_05325 [Oscillospiraceae bacterium]